MLSILYREVAEEWYSAPLILLHYTGDKSDLNNYMLISFNKDSTLQRYCNWFIFEILAARMKDRTTDEPKF